MVVTTLNFPLSLLSSVFVPHPVNNAVLSNNTALLIHHVLFIIFFHPSGLRRRRGYQISLVYVWSLIGVQLFCDPRDCSSPGFSVHGIFQARILEWVSVFFSKYHYCRENLLTFADLPD